MKKLIAMAAALMMSVTAFAGCKKATSQIKVYVPDGAPAFAVAKLMEEEFELSTSFIVVNPATIARPIISGDADLAILPTNTAAKLFNEGKQYVMLASVTQGNLYVLGKSGDSLSALVGKRLGVIGRGGTPDMLMKYLLKQSGIDYTENDIAQTGKVSIRYFENGGVMVPAYKTGAIDYGLFPEPVASSVPGKVEGTIRVAALHEEWTKLTGEILTQAVLVAKNSLIDSNKVYIDAFIEKMRLNKAWVEGNAQQALEIINKNLEKGTAPSIAAITNQAVINCNIACIKAFEAKTAVEAYLNSVIEIQDGIASALDKLPEARFYYAG